jgi:prepilin-type N-terminal cleavage/methylation domain-containing protein
MITRTPRRGFTLVELLTVIVCLATFLGLSALMIHTLIRVERTSRSRVAAAATLVRLAGEFKRDVHDAVAFELTPLRTALNLRLPHGATAVYLVEGAGLVVRREAPNVPKSEQTYPLETLGRPRLEKEMRDGQNLVRIAFEVGPSQPGAARPLPVALEAIVGRDHRHEKEARP